MGMTRFWTLVGFLAACATLSAQSFTGSISGLVTDPSGAVIAGANITVTDLQRNTSFRAASQ
jgi:hypothetical protein